MFDQVSFRRNTRLRKWPQSDNSWEERRRYQNGSFCMSNDIGFRIVCTKCGCLSIRIEEPLRAVREDEPLVIGKMSKRYAELRRLRQQVEIAEWLARKSNRPAVGRVSKKNARRSAFRPMHHPAAVIRIDDERGQKLPKCRDDDAQGTA
jgi:hypothetical protein